MSEGEDVPSHVAEQDELSQKMNKNAQKAASDADVMAELQDSLANVRFFDFYNALEFAFKKQVTYSQNSI